MDSDTDSSSPPQERKKNIQMVEVSSSDSSSDSSIEINVRRNSNQNTSNRGRRRRNQNEGVTERRRRSSSNSINQNSLPNDNKPKVISVSDTMTGDKSNKDSETSSSEVHPIAQQEIPNPIVSEPPASIPEPVTDNEVNYAIIRTHSVIKNVYTYKFHHEGNIIFSAKCKKRNPNKPIVITAGEDVHISVQGDYYLVPENSATMFTLRKRTETGTKLMTAHILHNMENYILPRLVTVSLTEENGLPMQTLVTRKPKMNRNGIFTLDFQNRFTIASEKNAIFYNQALGRSSQNVLCVRKIAKETLEINTTDKLPPYLIFAIGLVMFTANLGS